MSWLKSNWRWAAVNGFAVSVMVGVLTLGSTDWNAQTFDPELESGKWAIRFLLICLAMTPLNSYFGWSNAIKLRKPTGLWAFAFAIAHVAFVYADAQLTWFGFPVQPFIVLGLLGLLILIALAITSNRFAMRRLGKNWKRLHRLVYLGGSAVTFHAILATTVSKKLAVRDPQSADELKIYLAVLVVLLVVRMPLVRRLSKQIFALWQSRHQSDLPITPIVVPEITPEYLPRVYSDDHRVTINEFACKFQIESDETREWVTDSLVR